MTEASTIVWFRRDLRMADNASLSAASAAPGPLVPLYVHTGAEEAPWEPGRASRWWLERSLRQLDRDLRGRGSGLVVRQGPAVASLLDAAREAGARRVFFARRVEPAARRQEERVVAALRAAGLEVNASPPDLMFGPEGPLTASGRPFTQFTAYWRACRRLPPPAPPQPAPPCLPALPAAIGTRDDAVLGLAVGFGATRDQGGRADVALAGDDARPPSDWAPAATSTGGASWQPGERGAEARLMSFVAESLADYSWARDYPARDGVSRLSPHLHFGEISSRRVWHTVLAAQAERGGRLSVVDGSESAEPFLRELGWREFASHLLYHHPYITDRPFRSEFESFPWKDDPQGLAAWQDGLTGYPMVDAGMRQLSAEGWMHNRARMVAASFLTKDLLLPWQRGARWFWDRLVDADLASNTLGWQWTAGCGPDAAPYFRVFNPTVQGRRFDPEGEYVTRWAPELAGMPSRYVHEPWKAPQEVLAKAGIQLGKGYPTAVVDHGSARLHAIAGFASVRKGRTVTTAEGGR